MTLTCGGPLVSTLVSTWRRRGAAAWRRPAGLVQRWPARSILGHVWTVSHSCGGALFPERGRHSALGLPPSTRAQSLRTTVRADVREYCLRRQYCERGCSGDRSPPEWSLQDAPHPCTGESGSLRHALISSHLGVLHGHACRTLRLCLAAHAEVSPRCGVRKQSVPRLWHLHTRTRDPRTSPCRRATDERVEI